MPNDRDTHFLGFAKLQLPELDSLFAILYHAYATGDMAKRDEYSKRIETYLAQRAYDLAIYVLTHQLTTDHYLFPELVAKQEAIYDIPDLTQWPESSTE